MSIAKIRIKNKLEPHTVFKISPFKETIKRTKPHKHDGYHEIVIVIQGEGFHWVETNHYKITAPEIFFLKDGSVHCWQFTSIPKGYVILFKEEFLKDSNDLTLPELFRSITERTPNITLSGKEKIISIIEDIYHEYQSRTSYTDQIIQSYFKIIFSKILYNSQVQAPVVKSTSSLTENFLKLLSENALKYSKVNEYASLLNTTPQNLNAACRKYTGKNASILIASNTLLELKRLLLHTDKTIGEIASMMPFNDSSYLIKFFKKHEGITPSQFREKYFQ